MRGTLRAATAAVHQRLHIAPPFIAIAEQRLPMTAYHALLGQIAAFHFTVGTLLDVAADRRNMLARDLESLGAPAPTKQPWQPPSTAAARLGCAYVVEGSALGGKVIYRQLDYLFGKRAAGRRFFQGSPADPDRWRSFCRRVETEGRARGAVEEMILGAQSTFAFFEQLVSGVQAHG